MSIINDSHNYENIYRTKRFPMVFNELSVKMHENKLQGISSLFDIHFFKLYLEKLFFIN